MKRTLLIVLLSLFATYARADIVFQDNFESYNLGYWPAGWIPDANAHSSPGNKIVLDPVNNANKAFELYGATSPGWYAALAYHSIDYPDAYRLTARVYVASTPEPSHRYRAAIQMRNGTSWTNPAAELITFGHNGILYFALNDNIIMGSYAENQWYDVEIQYRLNADQLTLQYRLNGVDYGEFHKTVDPFMIGTLNYFEVNAGTGSAYFDDIIIQTAPVPIPPAVWLLGSGLIGLVGLRRKYTK